MRHPVVLIPGNLRSTLYATLDPAQTQKYGCNVSALTSSPFIMWYNAELVKDDPSISCFKQIFALDYNQTAHRTLYPIGVKVFVKDFGNTSSVETYDGLPASTSKKLYFSALVQALVDQLGYQRNVNVFAAPYDFRRAPNEQQVFYQNLTELVELAFMTNNNTKVVLVAQSLGNPTTLVKF